MLKLKIQIKSETQMIKFNEKENVLILGFLDIPLTFAF
jgi:hypothetical protein